MTTIFGEDKQCHSCRHSSSHTVMGSTNAFGPSDLDTRPPEMERSTMDYWIQKCPECGYCSPDISKGIKKFNEIVKSDFYQEQLHNPEFPELSDSFLCYAMIQEDACKFSVAAWACIHAAWTCDDDKEYESAKKCRQKAITLIYRAKAEGQDITTDQVGAEEALLVDLLRRSGQYEQSGEVCEKGLSMKPEKIISDILKFQKTLIMKGDTGCYTMGDITDGGK